MSERRTIVRQFWSEAKWKVIYRKKTVEERHKGERKMNTIYGRKRKNAE